MATHDRYNNGILKQLIRIANALEKIERKLPEQPILTANEMRDKIGLESMEHKETKTCYNCRYLDMDSLCYPCNQCGTDHIMWEEKIDRSDC